jgi:hypothetical protein
MRDATTGQPLFRKADYQISILKHAAKGCFSDPPGIVQKIKCSHLIVLGSQFYFQKLHTYGLTEYRCVRGTNNVEGGVHQNILMAFSSFSASPELADALLAEFRHRHNQRASVQN